ncbi:MerR family transcriptional regulator [Cryobacterium sp. TMT1-3]|uniref:MerR family transcriptional regulator n=1 Tax=Cryobacterium sp. TMT1-3 TaxID=1259237 RepID=UPI00106D4514|nr:MerR family transcriptional regulator [Cryobacterium sp. TMT1-3]TFC28352.1 MerR family transcriptional regulator [Cryobacterium sp. TMT1-3]
MQIGELASKTGVSARALRHYEERGLLIPERSSAGYRDYAQEDIVRVAQIKTMIDAGLNTASVKRYLDCARVGDHGTWLELCPDLRAELASISECLDRRQGELYERQQRLHDLASAN